MNPAHVKAGNNMKIVLDPDEHSLDEVMVVAFGTRSVQLSQDLLR